MRTLSSLVLCAAVPTLLAGCPGRGRVYAGKPSVGNGVRIEAKGSARVKGSSFAIVLLAYNDTGEAIEVNRNQIALVTPDGREFFRQGGRESHQVDPHGNHAVNIDLEIDPASAKGASGFYLRFDGVYAGSIRVDVPPMALGEPNFSPGQTNATFVSTAAAKASEPTREKEKPGMFRRMFNAARGETTETAASTEKAPETIQQYRGPRRQIKAKGTKCAAMPLKTKDIGEQMGFIMDELLLTELQSSGFEAIGPDDINAMIGFEKTKEAVGCDEMSCISEIGNALGVDYLAAGNVASLEGSVVLTLKLIDVKNAKVLSRVNKVAEGGQKGLPRMIAEAVQDLVERSAL